MTAAEKHIKFYNGLKGKSISVSRLKRFYDEVKKTLSTPGVNGYKSDLEFIAYRIAGGIMSAGDATTLTIKQIAPIKHAAPKVVMREKIIVKRVVKKVSDPKVVAQLNAAQQTVKNLNKKLKTPSKKTVVNASKSLNGSKSPAPQQEVKEVNKVDAKRSIPSVNGFTTADKAPEKAEDTFTLPGTVGTLLGELQAFKLVIVIAGENHSLKSELAKQIADAFINAGFSVGWIDWEQGGLQSKDTRASVNRCISPENRQHFHINPDLDRNTEAVEELTDYFEVIFIDSATMLEDNSNKWLEAFRKKYPKTIWVPIMQLTKDGSTRGSSSAEFNAPIVLKTMRTDRADYKSAYAYVYKNRGNPDSVGQYYAIAEKKILGKDYLEKLEQVA